MPAWWIPSWLIIRFTHARAANSIFALSYLSSHTQINSITYEEKNSSFDNEYSRVFCAKRKDKKRFSLLHKIWIITSRMKYARRMLQCRWNLQNTAFLCQCASIFSSERIHDAVVFHGFPLSQPGCSLGCLFPSWKCTRIFDFDISATWRKADFMNRSARIRRKNMASNQGDAQCPTARGKIGEKNVERDFSFLFFFSFFF